MALKIREVNGEAWYMDGNKRITKAEYQERCSEVRVRRFKVSANGKLTEVTNNGN